jgi:hypothetical protein
MWVSLGPEIVNRLDEYFLGYISLEQLEDWFHRAVLDLDLRDRPADANLVWAIKLRLAEFSNGDMNEGELRAALLEIAREYAPANDLAADRTEIGTLVIMGSLIDSSIFVGTPA